MLMEKGPQGPITFGVISLDSIFFFNLLCILLMWTYFKVFYMVLALQVKESVVA